MLVDVVSYYSGSRMFFLESFESKSIKKKAVLSNVFDNFHSHEMEELFCLALIVDVKVCQTFSNQHFGQGE